MRGYLLLASLVLAGCGDPTAPAFEGTYHLVTANGESLPAPYNPASNVFVMAGSLIAENGDMFISLGLGEPGSQPSSWTALNLERAYERQGDSLVVIGSGEGGRVLSTDVRLRLNVPLPPSTGFGTAPFTMIFREP